MGVLSIPVAGPSLIGYLSPQYAMDDDIREDCSGITVIPADRLILGDPKLLRSAVMAIVLTIDVPILELGLKVDR